MIKQYDRLAAVKYAQEFALKRNPNFYDYSNIGGDCTNFISQCLKAGGIEFNFDPINGWFYRSTNDHSASWTSVFYFQKFLLNNKGSGPSGYIDKLENLEIGDLIQLRQNPTDFNHTVIISKIENGHIFVCAHSDDSLDRSLEDYYFIEARGIKVAETAL